MTTELTVDSILEAFPNTIPPIVGRPTSQNLTLLKQLLFENAATIPSNIGGGNHGHLGVIMTQPRYLTMVGNAWVPPLNPGVAPVIPDGSSGPAVIRITAQHRNEQALFRTYNNVDKALKQQIQNAVPLMYIKSLADRVLRFTNVTARQLLQHLVRTYGKLSTIQLAHNDQEFKQAYDTNEPIENLFEQIEDTSDLADEAGIPYSAAQIIANTITILTKTGCYSEAIRIWKRKPDANKTWPNLKMHFSEAEEELREARMTATELGYNQQEANNVMDESEEYVARTADALVNLATATQADRQMLADLTAANLAQAESVCKLNEEITVLRNQLRQARQQRGGQPPTERPPPRNPPTQRGKEYCHTCGFFPIGARYIHKGKFCRRKATGHKDDATWTNNMGGSQQNKPE